MKSLIFAIFSLLVALPVGSLHGQSGGQKTIAATLDIYVFPSKGQDATQQSEDEASCYQWAVTNSGSDPFAVQKQQAADAQQAQANQQQASQAGTGSGARGAVGGAAVGALVGEIASDDAGKGAAYGAALGLIRGRRRGAQQQQQAQQQVQAQTEQQQQLTQSQMDNFKKAFSACMEGKNYIAKY